MTINNHQAPVTCDNVSDEEACEAPATFDCHWPLQPSAKCEQHAMELGSLANVMGFVLLVSRREGVATEGGV